MFRAARALLFRLEPERAHDIGLQCLDLWLVRSLLRVLWGSRIAPSPRRVMGLEFPNPVGLAAGLDKNARHVAGLAGLGFGFLELGTVTPRPQPGNPRPRLFRLPAAEALINRFGFNSEGVEALVERLSRGPQPKGPILGINIGKNRETPAQQAVDDYLYALRQVYAVADYVAVNISSPNTPGLRELQSSTSLEHLLGALKQAQTDLARNHQRYVPLALKIAPDLEPSALRELASVLRRHQVDGVIATNTTSTRPGVTGLPHADESGGLSGRPLAPLALAVLTTLGKALGKDIPVIAVGGIMSGDDAQARMRAGASLVQLYTGLIYRGPRLVAEVANKLSEGYPPVANGAFPGAAHDDPKA